MSFEKMLSDLEALAARLEKENLTVEEGITVYEQGLELTKKCLASLSASKTRITEIRKEMDKLVDAPFDQGEE